LTSMAFLVTTTGGGESHGPRHIDAETVTTVAGRRLCGLGTLLAT
jgi:hypothetical protein